MVVCWEKVLILFNLFLTHNWIISSRLWQQLVRFANIYRNLTFLLQEIGSNCKLSQIMWKMAVFLIARAEWNLSTRSFKHSVSLLLAGGLYQPWFVAVRRSCTVHDTLCMYRCMQTHTVLFLKTVMTQKSSSSSQLHFKTLPSRQSLLPGRVSVSDFELC